MHQSPCKLSLAGRGEVTWAKEERKQLEGQYIEGGVAPQQPRKTMVCGQGGYELDKAGGQKMAARRSQQNCRGRRRGRVAGGAAGGVEGGSALP